MQVKKNTSYNISLIGDACVGKTTLANSLLKVPFTEEYTPTVGASMVKIPYTEGGIVTTLMVWDTAGMEKYRSLAPVYYRDSNAAVIVYDVTNKDSFDHVEDWLHLYYDTVKENLPSIIVGNKADLSDQIQVLTDEGIALAQKHQSKFMETSAKTGIGLNEFIKLLITELHSSNAKSQIEASNQEPAKHSCC